MAITFTGATISGGITCVTPPILVSLYVWGRQNNGVTGLNNSNTGALASPRQVGAATANDWTVVSDTGTSNAGIINGVRGDGTLWSWGPAAFGSAFSDTINRSSPTQVGILTTWLSTYGGYNTGFAIKTDGTFWSWGLGDSGSLGNNTTARISSPIQVGSLTNWTGKLAGTGSTVLAVKSDGTLPRWGLQVWCCS